MLCGALPQRQGKTQIERERMTAMPLIFACVWILIIWVLQIGILLVAGYVIRDWIRDGVDLYDYGWVISLIALILLGIMLFITITNRILESIS